MIFSSMKAKKYIYRVSKSEILQPCSQIVYTIFHTTYAYRYITRFKQKKNTYFGQLFWV